MKSRLSLCYWRRCWFTTNVLSNHFTLLKVLKCSLCNCIREESDFIKGLCGWLEVEPKGDLRILSYFSKLNYLTGKSDKGPFISAVHQPLKFVSVQLTSFCIICLVSESLEESLKRLRFFICVANCVLSESLKEIGQPAFWAKSAWRHKLKIRYLSCGLCFISWTEPPSSKRDIKGLFSSWK